MLCTYFYGNIYLSKQQSYGKLPLSPLPFGSLWVYAFTHTYKHKKTVTVVVVGAQEGVK